MELWRERDVLSSVSFDMTAHVSITLGQTSTSFPLLSSPHSLVANRVQGKSQPRAGCQSRPGIQLDSPAHQSSRHTTILSP